MFRTEGVPHDVKEALARARRQALEEERKRRILDPKSRMIGVDVAALEQQKREKEARLQEERERERMHDEYRVLMDQRAQQIDTMMQRERRAMAMDDDTYRKTLQRPEYRREFDLNNPNAKKEELPARVGDDDPRLGPASVQKFSGEDLSATERRRLQRAQMETWVAQQKADRDARKQSEEDEERAFQERQEEMNFVAQQMEESVSVARRELSEAIRDYNVAMAHARRQKSAEERQRELEHDMHEITHHLTSDLLNEPLEATLDATGRRFISDRFKGLRPDQREEIAQTQRRQAAELQLRRAQEKLDEAEAARDAERQRRAALMMEREMQRQRRNAALELRETHLRQADEKKQRYAQLYNQVYKNEITDDFHSRFGTSLR